MECNSFVHATVIHMIIFIDAYLNVSHNAPFSQAHKFCQTLGVGHAEGAGSADGILKGLFR